MKKLLTSLLAIALAAPAFAPQAARANVSNVWASACTGGLNVIVTEEDPTAPPPSIDWQTISQSGHDNPRGSVPNPHVAGGRARDFIFWVDVGFTAGTTGTVRANGRSSEAYGHFVAEGECPSLGSVRGVAFEDFNRNGWLDGGEPLITSASWKLTGGGDWQICGYVGGDATYGPTVKPGVYYVIPIAQPGWRATTPVRAVGVPSLAYASLHNNLGFVRDPFSGGNACGQYAPPSGTPPAVPGIPPDQPPLPSQRPLPSVPPTIPSSSNIPGTLSGYGIFNTLLAAANVAGLMPAWTNAQNITLFAPTDAAFAKLPPGVLNQWLNNPAQLNYILRCHMANGSLAAPTQGFPVTVRTQCGRLATLRNTAGILSVTGDNFASASNGIATTGGLIYPVDAVLFTR